MSDLEGYQEMIKKLMQEPKARKIALEDMTAEECLKGISAEDLLENLPEEVKDALKDKLH